MILISFLLKLKISYLYSFFTIILSIKYFILQFFISIGNKIEYFYFIYIKPIFSDSFSSNNDTLKLNRSSDPFFEWLAGLIDGDGHFNLSKGGTARLQITMGIRDKKALYEIQQKLGGSIYTIANANALRYQLSHKKGLIVLLNGVNGLIRNPPSPLAPLLI